jgi:hypothetical protein
MTDDEKAIAWEKYVSNCLRSPETRDTFNIHREMLEWLVEQIPGSHVKNATRKTLTARRVRMLVDNIKSIRHSNGRPYKKDGFASVFEVAAQAFPGHSPDSIENIYKSVTGQNRILPPDPVEDLAWFGRQIAIGKYMSTKKTWDISELSETASIDPEAVLPPEWFLK